MDNLPIILFESYPDCTGSALQLYNCMFNSAINNQYRLMWAVDNTSPYIGQDNTINFFDQSLDRKRIILDNTRLIIDSNRYIHKLDSNYRIHVRHGLLLKRCDNYVINIGQADAILTTSTFMRDIDTSVYPAYNKDKFIITGLPSLDTLYNKMNLYENGFLHALTNTTSTYDKIIYWMPTFRQHRLGGTLAGKLYEYGVPILHTYDDWNRLNQLCKELNVLILLQMHHAQVTPLRDIPILSNVKVIDEKIKCQYKVTTYNIMSASDALVTDYSAAYYEYIMLNKPIGLIVEDIVEYNKSAGFYVNYLDVIKGDYMMNYKQFASFIQRIAYNVDLSKVVRTQSLNKIHQYKDNNATQRVMDWIYTHNIL